MTTWRSYNYPHVTAVYWCLYRLARNGYPGLVESHSWEWFLSQAVNTTLGMKSQGRYNALGLMVGSVWRHLLDDMKQEAATTPSLTWIQKGVQDLEAFFSSRAQRWSSEAFPFGSEEPSPSS